MAVAVAASAAVDAIGIDPGGKTRLDQFGDGLAVLDTLRGRLGSQRFVFARRVITRPADSVGEQHDACSESQFAERRQR